MYPKKYWTLFKSFIAASLEYRGALFLWILVEMMSLTTAIFLWTAVFRTNNHVGGYDYSKLISYYLLIPIIGGFTSIFVSEQLPRKIKDGQISTDLLKPFSIAISNLLNQFAIKLTQLTIKLPIYFMVGLFFNIAFKISFNWNFLALSLFVCLFSYLLHFSIDILISYTAFWFDDAWSLSHLKYIIMLVFGGLSFPLDLLPRNVQNVFNFLPFRFIYYFPVKVAQGDFKVSYFISEFSQLIIWLVGFLILGNIVWKKGLRKYGAYGN